MENSKSLGISHEREQEMLAKAKTHIVTCGSFLSARQLSTYLDIQAELLAPALAGWEADHRIFSIEHEDCSLFPCYAFSTGAGLSPEPGLRDVLAILSPMKDGWALSFWFITPNGFLGGRRPQDVIATDPLQVALAAQDEIDGVSHG